MIKLTKKELKKMNGLNKRMKETPMVLLFGKHDMQKNAQQRLADFLDELGEKYSFDPKTMFGINQGTGEVVLK